MMVSQGFTRRAFFTNIGRAVRGRVQRAIAAPAAPPPPRLEWLRPPGALEEQAFLATCTRCTDCIEACPYDSIRRLGAEFGVAAGTPAIIVEQSPCYLCVDMPCVAACQVHALVATERSAVRMATADVDPSRCFQAQGQPCDYCLTRCPIGKTAINLNEEGVPRIDHEHCAGCGVCAYLCPAAAVTMSHVEAVTS